MMNELQGKTAFVTGGGRDIGRAVCIKLACAGASVLVNYFDNPEEAQETVNIIKGFGAKAVACQGDATKTEDIQRCIDKALSEFGNKIDVVVNVAGGLVARKKMEEMDEAFWDFVMNVNLKSTFLVSKLALPFMPEGGVIVNFSSQAARDGGGPGAIAYAAAKSGVLNFTRGLAKELGPKKIRVNCVSPGMINTTFHNVFTKPEVRQRVAAATPLGREGEAEEIANIVLFLSSEASSFVNGASIEVNGGVHFV
jgi:3-oxoacyl-[acyl-carrier protein] reductase